MASYERIKKMLINLVGKEMLNINTQATLTKGMRMLRAADDWESIRISNSKKKWAFCR